MDIKRTQRLLKFCMTGNVPALLVGHSGVGKSAVVEQTSKQILPEHKVIKLMLSQCDIGDLIGLPHIEEINLKSGEIKINKGSKTVKVTEWARPGWMPFEPVTLFLDELNQANRDVEAAAFQLVYEKRIHNHFLHPDSVVIAAINPSTSEYTTANTLSSALVKRFVVIPFEPKPEEIVSYGRSSGIFHEGILGYMDFNKADVGVSKALEIGMQIEPTPRTWEMASKLLRAAEKLSPQEASKDEVIVDILSTTVGNGTAASYLKYMESKDKPLEFDAIMKDWDSISEKFESFRKEGREDLVSSTVSNVFEGLLRYGQSFKDKFQYTGFVNDIDSEDKEQKETALKQFNSNSELYDKVGLANISTFINNLPKDLFYQFVYNFISHEMIAPEMTPQEAINRANAHFSMIIYLFTGVIKSNKNLWKRVKSEASDISEFAKKKTSQQ